MKGRSLVWIAILFGLLLSLLCCSAICSEAPESFRPPAVPLVACDPYFSIWSCADRLTDDWPRHWTGKPQALQSMMRVDGQVYRLMGPEPKTAPAATQVTVEVLPTRSIYRFETPEVAVTLTFMTGSLPDNIEVLSRPVTYLTWDVRARDGKSHAVSVYFDSTAEAAVNTPDQQVVWSREKIAGLSTLRFGSRDQPILGKKGDDLRIDWGYLYIAAPQSQSPKCVVAPFAAARNGFADTGAIPETDDTRMPRAVEDDWPVAAFVFDLGKVGARTVSRRLMLAYDDIYAIDYMHQHLRAYWRRNGAEAADLLKAAAKDYTSLQKRCARFDEELMADLRKSGGDKYARFCALAFRQCLAGVKIAADANGRPMIFPKENFSNGCISTVDVIYPMDPFFLLFSPTLMKASLVPVLEYAASNRWPFPFAPHDLGTYPKAIGQVYAMGGNEGDMMPVEESGNMLILLAALAHSEGNADFSVRYWDSITKWAEYLKKQGLDPANQLCTDDFAGHLAHNANLSIKAITGLAAYASLCDIRGKKRTAQTYRKLAQEYAAKWAQMADDGDHYRLAFDAKGTWSQKYNLVWDKILGFGLFPAAVAEKEMAFYRKSLNRYGLPLDSRQTWAKVDWTTWTATLTGKREDFEAILSPMYDFLSATPQRVPITDLYWTLDAKEVGMQARPVIGGVFIKLLYDPEVWHKYTSRDKTSPGAWAAFPKPPQIEVIVPSAQTQPALWRYTIDKPADSWYKPDFNASGWREGPSGFGSPGTPGAVVGTEWHSDDIWIRRDFTLPEGDYTKARLWLHHDEDVEVYINGVPAAQQGGYITEYELVDLNPDAVKALKPGKNVIAAHCHQTVGGQYVDMGIVRVK
jgi:hypothetical protein